MSTGSTTRRIICPIIADSVCFDVLGGGVAPTVAGFWLLASVNSVCRGDE